MKSNCLYGRPVCVFLFDEADSHRHEDRRPIRREPGVEYRSYIEF